MPTKLILAFDPGVSGGIAMGIDEPILYPMPESVHDLAELLINAQISAEAPLEAHVELVGGFIPSGTDAQGKQKGQPGSRMFTFGQSYGQILGVLAALQIPVHLHRPQKWQALLGIGNSSGMPKHKWKAKLREQAQRAFPTKKVTLQTADAALIWFLANKGKLI